MKQVKPIWFKGIVTIKVTGHYPERFFDLFARHGIPVWSIAKQSDVDCIADIYLSDLSQIRRLRRQTHYKFKFIRKSGLPFFYQRIKKYRQLVISFMIACFIFLYFTQSILFIDINGVPAERAEQLITSLENYGIKRGKLKYLMDKPDQIQSKILADYPDILWVGIVPDGITYRLEVITKKQAPVREKSQRTHLYAKKDGVISKILVAKGRSLVEVNDFVKKGQMIVTGDLNELEQKDSDQDKQLVEIEAEVFATTWYEAKITVPFEGLYQIETGSLKDKYYLTIGSFQLPIWGFGSTDFSDEKVVSDQRQLTIANWTFPLSILINTHKEVEVIHQERSEEEAITLGLEQARQNLLRELDSTSSIIDEKILHQSAENGKVNLHVYFTVNENIVNTIESSQGD